MLWDDGETPPSHNLLFPLTRENLTELNESKDGVAKGVRSDIRLGLTTAEADDGFVARKATYGSNVYWQSPYKSLRSHFLEAVGTPVPKMLLGTALLSLIVSMIEDPRMGWIGGVAVMIAVFVGGLVHAAAATMKGSMYRKLTRIHNSRHVKVVRDGTPMRVPNSDVEVGDVVLLENGDVVPADGLFLQGHWLEIDESVMTGDPEAVHKSVREPFVLSGCQVVKGVGTMLVTAVGSYSEWGITMARLVQDPPQTFLQMRLEGVAKMVGKIGMAFAAMTFLGLVVRWVVDEALEGFDVHDLAVLCEFGVLASAMIFLAFPEGLPMVVTTSLAFSMNRMLQEHILLRQLDGCETMATVTGVCCDKVGVLTENAMAVTQGWFAGKTFDKVPSTNDLPAAAIELLVTGISVNSTAFLHLTDEHRMEFVGSTTECALLLFARFLGGEYEIERMRKPLSLLCPFSPERRRMSAVVKEKSGHRLYCKGAAKVVLDLCTSYINAEGRVVPLIDEVREDLADNIVVMESSGLRVLCLAYRDVSPYAAAGTAKIPEEELTAVAVVGIHDPLRRSTLSAVLACKRAGIMVRLVSGDSTMTANGIARACGILGDNGISIHGATLRSLGERELVEILPRIQVVAPATPADKLFLVSKLREMGEVIATTGDHTDDAAVLKEADVGLSPGHVATDVAKDCADVVVLDDSLASVARVLLWGRMIHENVRKFMEFQLTAGAVALAVVFVGAVATGQSPLEPVHLLWINLLADIFASVALGIDRPVDELLDHDPQDYTSLPSPSMWRTITVQSALQIVVLLSLLFSGKKWGDLISHSFEHYTLIFNTFVMCQFFNEINCRYINRGRSLRTMVPRDGVFPLVWMVAFIVQILVVEFGQSFMKTTHLTLGQWILSVSLGLLCLPVGALVKYIPSIIVGDVDQDIPKRRRSHPRWPRQHDQETQTLVTATMLDQLPLVDIELC